MKNRIIWGLLTGFLIVGVTLSFGLSELTRQNARQAWEAEVEQRAQILSSAIYGWLEESYAPVSGLAVLFENSNHVTEDEFIGATESLEARATNPFVDAYGVARMDAARKWSITYRSDAMGFLSQNLSKRDHLELQRISEITLKNPDQIILGAPLESFKEGNFVPISLAVVGGKEPLLVIGVLNFEALIDGLFEIHKPVGLSVYIEGKFLGQKGLKTIKNPLERAISSARYTVKTRSLSARANLVFTWYASDLFINGIKDGLADLILFGGIIFSCIITFFIGTLIHQNSVIQVKVKKATYQLTENQHRLNLALVSSGIGFWDWNIEQDVIEWDDGQHKIMGTDPDKGVLNFKDFAAIVHPEDLAGLKSKVEKTLAGDEEFQVEYRIIRSDGLERILDVYGRVLKNRAGKPIRMIGTTLDISERKQVALDLEHQKEFLETTLNSLSHPFYVIDAKTYEIVLINDVARERGVQGATTCHALTHRRDTPCQDEKDPCPLETVKKTKAPVVVEHLHYDREGNESIVEVHGYPILDEHGEVAQMIEYSLDITDRKMIESELVQKNILMDAMIDSPKDIIIFSLDKNYRYIVFNKAHENEMERVYGTRIKRGMSMLDAITIPDLVPLIKEILDRVLGGESFSEVQQQPDTGIYYEFNWGVIRNEQNEIDGISAFIRDITERKQLEDQLKERIKEQENTQSAMLNMMDDLDEEKARAEEATKAKGDFLANMSHEIRTPMNAVLGINHLLSKTELTQKQQDYVDKIYYSAKNLLGIINDILDFSKIEAGKLQMETINFDLNETIENLSSIISVKAQEKGLELIINASKDIPYFLIGDPLRLGQVLINLANNAIKFTEEGEIEVSIEVEEQVGESVRLKFTMRDTGIGLTQEQQGRLFQSFSQADSSTTRKFGGTGLGLAISKYLVEQMGGKIWIDSEKGVGSCFQFTANFGVQLDQKEHPRIIPEELQNTTVLIADDNATTRDVLSDYLKHFGFNVLEATDGALAIQIVEEKNSQVERIQNIDVVLMDWQMPKIDGIEASRMIQSRVAVDRMPKIIMITAYGREEIFQQVQGLDLDGILVKPITQSILFDSIMASFGHEILEKEHGLRDELALPKEIESIKGAKILLVEDNEINQQVAVELLESEGMTVSIANNGQEGVNMALSAEPGTAFDIVLMDLQMPVMGGIEATQVIRKTIGKDQLPILAMTADAMSGVKDKVLQVGMNDYVTKPINPKELFSALVKWIDAARIEQDPKVPENLLQKEEEQGVDVVLPGTTEWVNSQSTGDKIVDMESVDFNCIHFEEGLTRVNQNKKLYLNLLKKFRNNNQRIVEEIGEALGENDITTAERLAHTLKGVAGNLGAESLFNLAQKLDEILKIEPVDPVAFEQLRIDTGLELSKVMQLMKVVLEVNRHKQHPQSGKVDVGALSQLMDDLKQQLEDYDSDATKTFDALKQAFGDKGVMFDLEGLGNKIELYDFEGAIDILETIMISKIS